MNRQANRTQNIAIYIVQDQDVRLLTRLDADQRGEFHTTITVPLNLLPGTAAIIASNTIDDSRPIPASPDAIVSLEIQSAGQPRGAK